MKGTRARSWGWLAGACVALVAGSAHGQGKAEEKRERAEEARAEGKPPPPDTGPEMPPRPKTEVGIVPVVGGSSDIGIGVGEISNVARLAPGYLPFRWRLEDGAFATARPPHDGKWTFPYQDYYLLFIVPDLVPGKLRLEVRASMTSETTLRYYGLGNASTIEPKENPSDAYYLYARAHPTLHVKARMKLGGPLFALVGDELTYNWIDRAPNTKLTNEIDHGTPEQKALLGSTKPHFVDLFEYALVLDTRDNEISTTSGMWHQLKLRLSPGGTELFPYRYGQANLTLRGYVSPVRRILTFAMRAVADLQFGNPPFYELSRFEDTSALGGTQGVRGVPAQRYYGKIKLFGNFETRVKVVDFHALGKDLRFGVVGFFDGGRLWADYRSQPELDGNGLGLKWGAGGGLRLQGGETFVLRLDVAYSPDATPVSAYFGAGQMF